MKVRLDDLEYRILCEVADHYGTTPAQLAKRLVMYRAQEIYVQLKAEGGVGGGGGVDSQGTPPPDHPTTGPGGTP